VDVTEQAASDRNTDLPSSFTPDGRGGCPCKRHHGYLAFARVAGCHEPDLEMIFSKLFQSTSIRRRTDTVRHASKVAGSAQRNPTAFRRTSIVQQQQEQSMRRPFQRIS